MRVLRREGRLGRRLRDQDELARSQSSESATVDPLHVMDWVSLFPLAVNEENAAGGPVVTAPTNGAAGVLPAVLHYDVRFVPHAHDEGVAGFLLTAGAIGARYKQNASISGAEVDCQSEVGAACLWRPGHSARFWAVRRPRWRTLRRSAWNTTSA